MPSVVAYHRPNTLDEAAELLAQPNRRAIGGGTVVVPEARVASADGFELVDLQGLGLEGVTAADGARLRLGAMVRVAALIGHADVPDLLGSLARRELPSTLRHQATIGGTVALAPADSVLLAGLLVHDTIVEFHGDQPAPLASVLANGVGARLITAITLDSAAGRSAIAATGRTPADDPIVGAVGRLDPAGGGLRVAVTGVAPAPIEVNPESPASELDPPGDFRGSADYRRHLATVLTNRVKAQLDADAGAQA